MNGKFKSMHHRAKLKTYFVVSRKTSKTEFHEMKFSLTENTKETYLSFKRKRKRKVSSSTDGLASDASTPMSTSTPSSSQKFFGPDFNADLVYKSTGVVHSELKFVKKTTYICRAEIHFLTFSKSKVQKYIFRHFKNGKNSIFAAKKKMCVKL